MVLRGQLVRSSLQSLEILRIERTLALDWVPLLSGVNFSQIIVGLTLIPCVLPLGGKTEPILILLKILLSQIGPSIIWSNQRLDLAG